MDEPDVKGYIVFRGQSRTSMVRLTSKPLPSSPKPAWEDAGYQGAGLPAGTTLVYAFSALDTSLNAGAPVFVEVSIPDTLPQLSPWQRAPPAKGRYPSPGSLASPATSRSTGFRESPTAPMPWWRSFRRR